MHTGPLVYLLPFKGITRSALEASEECLLFPVFTSALLTCREIYTVGPFMTPLLREGLVYVGGWRHICHVLIISAWTLVLDHCACSLNPMLRTGCLELVGYTISGDKFPCVHTTKWQFACVACSLPILLTVVVVNWLFDFTCYWPGFILASVAG